MRRAAAWAVALLLFLVMGADGRTVRECAEWDPAIGDWTHERPCGED